VEFDATIFGASNGGFIGRNRFCGSKSLAQQTGLFDASSHECVSDRVSAGLAQRRVHFNRAHGIGVAFNAQASGAIFGNGFAAGTISARATAN
jgi:hypothetical protein